MLRLPSLNPIKQPTGVMPMPDLLDLIARDTRAEAMSGMAGRASLIRAQALEAVKKAGPSGMTPDECAQSLRLTVLAVRPRFTELKQAGLIAPTGERRRNKSGSTAAVYAATMRDVLATTQRSA